jgi:hypothetical protein
VKSVVDLLRQGKTFQVVSEPVTNNLSPATCKSFPLNTPAAFKILLEKFQPGLKTFPPRFSILRLAVEKEEIHSCEYAKPARQFSSPRRRSSGSTGRLELPVQSAIARTLAYGALLGLLVEALPRIVVVARE